MSFIYECRHFDQHEYHVFLGPGVSNSLTVADFPANFFFYEQSFGVVSWRKTFQVNDKLNKLAEKIQPDAVITTSGPAYWNTKVPHVMGFNLPLYIYPESPYVQGLSRKKKLRLRLKRLLHYHFFRRDATVFVTQTDDVNQRVKSAFNTSQVYTVTNTYNNFYVDWRKHENKLPARQEGEVRLVTVSAWYEHKNLDIIPEIVDLLRARKLSKVKFVLTISKEDYEQHIGEDYADYIITTGAVKPEECPSLYNECDILFLPTLAECFSASYPEAMIMKKPIITTDLGFAKSICGPAALYYEAKNAEAAANAIEELLANKTRHDSLIAKGIEQLQHFDSAYQRAEKYLSICEQLTVKREN